MRALALVVLCACSTTIRVSRDELQADIAEHFPHEIDKRLVVVRLSDPEVSLPGSRFDLRVRVEATTMTGRSTVAGTARVDGQLEYIEAEHAFYLRQPRVTQLDLEPATGPGHAARLWNRVDVTSTVRAVILDVLSRHPIYRVKDPKAIRHLRSARIEDGSLLLKIGW
jgi:hypothetical protein